MLDGNTWKNLTMSKQMKFYNSGFLKLSTNYSLTKYTHTHTHIYIYIYIYIKSGFGIKQPTRVCLYAIKHQPTINLIHRTDPSHEKAEII